jgi:hypothetical protein
MTTIVTASSDDTVIRCPSAAVLKGVASAALATVGRWRHRLLKSAGQQFIGAIAVIIVIIIIIARLLLLGRRSMTRRRHFIGICSSELLIIKSQKFIMPLQAAWAAGAKLIW